MDDATGSVSLEELQLATRNHGLPLETLRYSVTPVGMHYVLTHYDIPEIDPESWRLDVNGRVARPTFLSLDDLRAMPRVTAAVTMECAGNGRALLEPHVASQPWLLEAVGTGEWTGVPLVSVLDAAGVDQDAVEVVFTGADRGIEGGTEQSFQRSLSLDDATSPEVMLAYELNGAPLPPQHGFPLRLVVPGWYGMTSVKWLASLTVTDTAFSGYQQAQSYRLRKAEDEPGSPLNRMSVRSLLIPPGIPDFFTRTRTLRAGGCSITGRAWSGHGPVANVDVSTDGGIKWEQAMLDPPQQGPWAWQGWRFDWHAVVGEHELCCRATDVAGNEQPPRPTWNLGGYANNAVQRLCVFVTD
jgi:DMSO/TMAO reductase YedYZ molybdopterin-dependent catalytic subunit